MVPRRKRILRGIVAIGLALGAASGCLQFKGLGPAMQKLWVEPGMQALGNFALGANEFRVAQGRWPKDYLELSNFLKTSDSETYHKLQPIQFSHTEFSDTPNGGLKVTGPIVIVLPGGTYTDSGARVTLSGETNTINEMTISPFDPHEPSSVVTPKEETIQIEK